MTSGAIQRLAPVCIVVRPIVDMLASTIMERPKSAICACNLSSNKMLAYKQLLLSVSTARFSALTNDDTYSAEITMDDTLTMKVR